MPKQIIFFTPGDPEQKARFLSTFGVPYVPVISETPIRVNLPGMLNELVFMMDIEALNTVQRHNLIANIAERFGISEQDVAADIDKLGCPILAKNGVVNKAGEIPQIVE